MGSVDSTVVGGRGYGGFGFGGGELIGLLAIFALFSGGFGFGGRRDGHGEGGGLPYHDRWVADRFNSIQGQMDFNGVNAHLGKLEGEVGRLGFANAMATKDAEIAALKCCCETNRNIDNLRFDTAKETWATNMNIDKTSCNILRAIENCCCETNRNIDSVKFQNEKDTCAIITAGNANTQRIVDWLSTNELKEASQKIAALEAQLNKQEIISHMKPVQAVPAYLQPNPFENFRPTVHCEPRRERRDECPFFV
jgi:hypothetical protein